jgi:VWFA-related protein
MRVLRFDAGIVFVAGLVAAALTSGTPAVRAQQQAPPVFRTGTSVVPVDVRVLDRNGRPVRGLTAADFTILENGVAQKIDYFSEHELTPSDPEPAVTLRPGAERPTGLVPQNRRLFLILLGRGRLQEPSKGLDATLRFVRERLLPQDQVAVMAWNRATDFTTDRARVAGVIERFRARHEMVEAHMRQTYGGLAALYASPRIPPHIQSLIDDVFGGPSAAGSREVLPGAPLGRAEADAKRTADVLQRQSEVEARGDAFRRFGWDDVRMADGIIDPTLGMTFEDYIVLNRQTMQDVGNLYAGIDYLRFIDGEKHLIFVTEHGFLLPRADYDRDLATFAADARVALNTVQTGGVRTELVGGFPVVRGGEQLAALRDVAERSGGQVSVSNRAEQAFDRILSSTGAGYLLGYTPSAPPDGRTRRIEVEVKRRGVEVAHRRAYVARPSPGRFDPRESLAATRLLAAANFPDDVGDLKFAATLTDVRAPVRAVDVDIALQADRVIFARDGDRYLAALNVAILAGDYYDRNVGQVWESRDIRIPADRIEAIRQGTLLITVRVPVRQAPVHVKIIVYDYGSDRIGMTTKRMR